MNSLTSRQRKIAYALGILVLLGPIIILGAPVSETVQRGVKSEVSGGVLARMRHEYQLGESTLGDIDPTSAAANLVLLGLRGMAATVLHQNAVTLQQRKEWGRLKSTVDSILKLQPHYIEVWKFQGWNLAFNVSREWDKVEDRFYWVKAGLKFLKNGADKNRTSTALLHNVGDFVGRKIGMADERNFYRRFFVRDPDEDQFGRGADPEVNPEGIDNYLMAREHFLQANELDEVYPIEGMTREVFRKSPVQALFDYAAAITRDFSASLGEMEGDKEAEDVKFEMSQQAWADAYREWTEVFGKEIFEGLDGITFMFNSTPEDLALMAEENEVTYEFQHRCWDLRVKMINYNFWKQLAECEQDDISVEAHRLIHRGKQAYANGDISDYEDADGLKISKAQENLENGLKATATMLDKYPYVGTHDEKILEVLIAVVYLSEVHKHNGREIPTDYPMADFVAKNRQYMSQALIDFRRELQ